MQICHCCHEILKSQYTGISFVGGGGVRYKQGILEYTSTRIVADGGLCELCKDNIAGNGYMLNMQICDMAREDYSYMQRRKFDLPQLKEVEDE